MTRRVWIAIYGVPMHRWIEANFKAIAQVWGRLIRLEQEVDDTMNYESMNILIDSDHFDRIQGDILLHIGVIGFQSYSIRNRAICTKFTIIQSSNNTAQGGSHGGGSSRV